MAGQWPGWGPRERIDLDLGAGHTLTWTGWGPDRALNPQYAGIPDVERWGAIIGHPTGPNPTIEAAAATGYCEGAVTFDGDVQRLIDPHSPKWTVDVWEPLTLSPSLLCGCGDHGFIRSGLWVPA